MYFLIVGCSEAGYHLSKALLASEHEVAVVEKNPAKHRILADELGSVAFAGDGTDEQTLKRAGVTRADAVVAVTGRDETNLVICQIAKHVFQVPRTMVLVKDPKNEPLFHILGVDVVVNEIHQILLSFEEGVPGRPFVHLMNLQAPGRELVSVSVPEGARVVGKRLRDVELPPNSMIALVVKRDRVELPSGALMLEAEDELVAVTQTHDEQTLYDILTEVE